VSPRPAEGNAEIDPSEGLAPQVTTQTIPLSDLHIDKATSQPQHPLKSGIDPYIGLETGIVAENITLLPKTRTQTTGGHDGTEKTVVLKKGESIATVLRDLGARPDEIAAIAAALGPRGRDGSGKEGQKLRVLMVPSSDGRRLQPVRVVVANDAGVEAVVALSDLGKYVSVDVRHFW
jgi:hypothetical protein